MFKNLVFTGNFILTYFWEHFICLLSFVKKSWLIRNIFTHLIAVGDIIIVENGHNDIYKNWYRQDHGPDHKNHVESKGVSLRRNGHHGHSGKLTEITEKLIKSCKLPILAKNLYKIPQQLANDFRKKRGSNLN